MREYPREIPHTALTATPRVAVKVTVHASAASIAGWTIITNYGFTIIFDAGYVLHLSSVNMLPVLRMHTITTLVLQGVE